jgi:hypothetical protein
LYRPGRGRENASSVERVLDRLHGLVDAHRHRPDGLHVGGRGALLRGDAVLAHLLVVLVLRRRDPAAQHAEGHHRDDDGRDGATQRAR